MNLNNKQGIFVRNLSKSYTHGIPVLQNVCMSVEQGTVYGLIGNSGCGKSTLLHCCLNLKERDAGEVFIFGEKVNKADEIKGTHIGYMPQDLAMYEHLSVTEMLKYFSTLYGMSGKCFKKKMDFLQNLMNLKEFRSRFIRNLSGGQKRRVSLSLTLIHDPKLLILDEPTVGLDPLLRESIWNYLFSLTATANTTIVITTHYIEEVKRANRVGVMRKGRILVEDDPALLMRLHNTELLEDVVREICYGDTQVQNALPKNTSIQSVKSSSLRNRPTPESAIANNLWHTGETSFMKNNVIPIQSIHRDHESLSKCVMASIKRSLAYSRITWVNFIRNPIFIFIVLFMPPFQLFTTGLVFGVEPKDTPIGVVNHEIPQWSRVCPDKILTRDDPRSRGCEVPTFSCNLLNHLQRGNFLKLIEFASTEDALKAVHQGYTQGIIEIPNNFSNYIYERAVFLRYAPEETVQGTVVKIQVDMTNFITMFTGLTTMYQGFFEFIQDLSELCGIDLSFIQLPFHFRDPVYGEMEGTARDYALPAIIVGLIFEICFAVTPLVLVTDSKCGVLERSKIAGLRSIEWMLGLTMTMASLAIVQAIICYIAMVYVIGFRVQGNFLLYVCLCVVSALLGGSLGLVVGAIFRNELVIIITAIYIIPVLMAHVGLLRPEEVVVRIYRTFVYYCFPTAALAKSMRFIMNRGQGLFHPLVWSGVLISLGWCSVFALIAFLIIKIKRV